MDPSADASILIVNDRRDALTALAELLEPLGVGILTAMSAREGIQIARTHALALAIVDVHMPEVDGFGMVRELRADPQMRELPVIFVSAVEATPAVRAAVFALDGADFVALPAPAGELRAKARLFVNLFRKNRTLQEQSRIISHEASRAVQEQRERFRLLAETATDYAIFFTDPDGVIREWTAGAESVLGYTAEEMIGQPGAVIFTAEDQAAGVPERELAEAARTGAAKDERWHLRKNGERFYAVGRLIALRDGGLRGFAKILRDATAAVQAEEQLREALARFESLADSMAQLAWMADPSGARFWYNRRWYEYTGTNLEQMKGWGFTTVLEPKKREEVVAEIRERCRDGHAWESQWEIRGRDGEYRCFLTQVAPVRDAGGQIVRWFGTNTDIDRVIRLQEQLKGSEEKFREIFETANEGIWLLDADAHIELVNERMARMLGYEIHELLGHLKTDFVFPQDVGYVRGLFEERRRGAVASVEVRFRHKDGHPVWTLLSARPLLRDGKFAGALDMFTDISARKDAARQFEEELKAQVAERTRALQEKSQQLESFAYTIAHDLRSPLRAISGYAEFTLDDFRDQLPEAAIVNLDKIRASAARLDLLIHDLLSYTRVSQVEFVEADVPLASSIGWALEQLKTEIHTKGAEIEVPPQLPAVRGERSILDQVFLNLFSNALKFVAPGVKPRITVGAEVRDRLVRVTVSDNGVGVPKEYQERIFRVFERLQGSQRFEGTGVGLAIVARATERLGGRAGVESEPGRGSTFWVELRKGGT